MSNVTTHPLNACSVDHTHMYKGEDVPRANVPATLDRAQGTSFEPQEVARAVRLEVWHSTFTNPEPEDYSTYELYDIDSNLIAQRKVMGY